MSQLASRASAAPLILVLERGEHAIFVSEIKEEGRTRCCFCVCVFTPSQPGPLDQGEEIKEEGRTRCCFCVCVCFYAQPTWTVRPGRRDQRGRKNSMLFLCVCVFTPSQPGPLDQGEEIKEEGRTRCCFCVCVCFYAQPTWTVRPGRRDQRGCACNLVTTDNSILYTPLPSDRVLTVDGKLLITVQNNPYSNTAGLSTTNEQAGLSTTNWTNSI